jgi:parvulin-like peptidyl-prolyl isomerase
VALLINGQRVDDATLGAEFSGIKSYFERQGNVSCCERDGEFRGYAKQNVISRVLLSQRALETTEVPADEEVNAALEKLKKDYGGESQFYYSIGATPEQADLVRRDLSVNLRVEKMIDGLCAGDPEPSDAELRAFYEKRIDSFRSEEEVRASHISKAPQRGDKRAEAYELFRQIRRQLLEGADFDELAREHSDRGKEQIDLGFFRRGELPEEFDLVAFSMNVGEISPVFGSSVGYHIVKITERKLAAARPFEEARDDVKQLFLQERRQERIRELVSELQGKATIEEVAESPV